MRTVSDRRLRRRVLAALDDAQVDWLNVRVDVRRGRVTLTGTVPTSSERLRIRIVAADTAGDGYVTDQLTVGPVGRDWDLDDADIVAGIHDALQAHHLDHGITVTATHHTATLTGDVPDNAARAVIRHLAQETPGVHFVDNKLRLRPTTTAATR